MDRVTMTTSELANIVAHSTGEDDPEVFIRLPDGTVYNVDTVSLGVSRSGEVVSVYLDGTTAG